MEIRQLLLHFNLVDNMRNGAVLEAAVGVGVSVLLAAHALVFDARKT
jgi:hypothetical protein